MLEILDLNNDKALNHSEFKNLRRMMDLNADKIVSPLEVMAWLTRNEYSICKNFSTYDDNLGYEQLFPPFFDWLDADQNGEINPRDIQAA